MPAVVLEQQVCAENLDLVDHAGKLDCSLTDVAATEQWEGEGVLQARRQRARAAACPRGSVPGPAGCLV